MVRLKLDPINKLIQTQINHKYNYIYWKELVRLTNNPLCRSSFTRILFSKFIVIQILKSEKR